MRYKKNIYDRTTRLHSLLKKLEFQVNRREKWSDIEPTFETTHNVLSELNEYISLNDDE